VPAELAPAVGWKGRIDSDPWAVAACAAAARQAHHRAVVRAARQAAVPPRGAAAAARRADLAQAPSPSRDPAAGREVAKLAQGPWPGAKPAKRAEGDTASQCHLQQTGWCRREPWAAARAHHRKAENASLGAAYSIRCRACPEAGGGRRLASVAQRQRGARRTNWAEQPFAARVPWRAAASEGRRCRHRF